MDGLQAAQSFFVAVQDVSYDQWRTFVDSLDLPAHYPGINGLGFIRYVAGEDKERYERKVRDANGALEPTYATYAVKPPGEPWVKRRPTESASSSSADPTFSP